MLDAIKKLMFQAKEYEIFDGSIIILFDKIADPLSKSQG